MLDEDADTVNCSGLLAAILVRAIQDARGSSAYTAEARAWLLADGLHLGELLGIDMRRWLKQPQQPRRQLSRQRVAVLDGARPQEVYAHESMFGKLNCSFTYRR